MKDGALGPLVCLVVILCFFIEAVFAKRRGNRPLITRLMGIFLPFAHPFSQKKDPSANKPSSTSLLLQLALTIMVFEALKETYSFLKDVDWSSLTERNKEAIHRFGLDLDRLNNNNARLDRAESLISLGDQISIEVSALLTSATLEAGLKHLQESHYITLTEEQSDGVVGIAIALRDRGVVSSEDYRQIRKYVSNIRNEVMHGKFDALNSTEVQELIRFTREFLATHRFA